MTFDNTLEKMITDGLIKPTTELSTDYAELTLDSFINNEAIKQIPVVKTLLAIYKGSLSIKEIFFCKKLLVFLNELHQGNINNIVYQEFLNNYNTDKKYRNKIIEQIIVLTDRFIEVEKSLIHANLFRAHSLQLLTWSQYTSLSNILSSFNLEAKKALENLNKRENEHGIKLYLGSYNIAEPSINLLLSAGLASVYGNPGNITLNPFGICFYQYGIKKEFSNPYNYWAEKCVVYHSLNKTTKNPL